jgi:hypothetical protein
MANLPTEPDPTILHHGTTLQRALAIEANGPDPDYREPGTGNLPPAEGFSTVIGDGRPCATGTPEQAAHNKHALFPGERWTGYPGGKCARVDHGDSLRRLPGRRTGTQR